MKMLQRQLRRLRHWDGYC